MKRRLQFLALIGRYLVSLSALSTALFFRVGIGSNIYAPFTTTPFGKGEGFYRASIGTRVWVVALLYIWMRLFAVFCLVGDSHFFHVNDWASWGQIFKSFYTWSFFWDGLYPSSAIVFMALSYAVVIVAILQMLIAYEFMPKHKRPEETTLGFSLLFGWFDKTKDKEGHYLIWQFIEPVLIALIGGGLYYFSFPIQAYFFLCSAIGLAIQGQAKRIKLRGQKRAFETAIKHREETTKLQKDLEKERQKLLVKEPDKQDEEITVAPW